MFNISKATLRMEQVLQEYKPGDFISYDELENKSKIKMDEKGKQYMRSALRRLKWEYHTFPKEGIELVSAKTVLAATYKRVKGMVSAGKRASRTVKILNKQFYDDLSPSDRVKFDATSSAIHLSRIQTDAGRRALIEGQNVPKVGNSKIPKDIKI